MATGRSMPPQTSQGQQPVGIEDFNIYSGKEQRMRKRGLRVLILVLDYVARNPARKADERPTLHK
jgi:hypothetical protein